MTHFREQHVAQDIPHAGDFTLSTLNVIAAPKADSSHAPGTTLTVRQIGSADHAGTATLLTPGKTYLLYLNPSGLDGSLASQFYVTGGDAGLYEVTNANTSTQRSTSAVTGDTSFSKMQDDEGDVLPQQVTLQGAAG